MKRVKMAIVILLLIFLLMLCVTARIYEKNFEFRGVVTEHETKELLDRYPKLKREKETIITKGNIELAGYWYNKKANQPIIVFSQGIRTKAVGYINEINFFATNGYSVFSFDNTGCGESGGDNIRGLPQSVVDLDCVLSYLENKDEYKNTKIFLYGHSWGGYAVCAVNMFNHRVSGVVERSGFNDTVKMIKRTITDRQNKIVANVIGPFVKIYEFMKFGKYANATAVAGINLANCPVMLMHSYDDTVVPFDVGIVGCKDAITKSSVTFKLYEDKNHHITDKEGVCDYKILEEVKKFFDELK